MDDVEGLLKASNYRTCSVVVNDQVPMVIDGVLIIWSLLDGLKIDAIDITSNISRGEYLKIAFDGYNIVVSYMSIYRNHTMEFYTFQDSKLAFKSIVCDDATFICNNVSYLHHDGLLFDLAYTHTDDTIVSLTKYTIDSLFPIPEVVKEIPLSRMVYGPSICKYKDNIIILGGSAPEDAERSTNDVYSYSTITKRITRHKDILNSILINIHTYIITIDNLIYLFNSSTVYILDMDTLKVRHHKNIDISEVFSVLRTDNDIIVYDEMKTISIVL